MYIAIGYHVSFKKFGHSSLSCLDGGRCFPCKTFGIYGFQLELKNKKKLKSNDTSYVSVEHNVVNCSFFGHFSRKLQPLRRSALTCI